jgi:lysophospholipase L1-like esterase
MSDTSSQAAGLPSASAPVRTSRSLAILIVLVTMTFSIAVAAGAGEFMVRNRERHRTSVPGTMPLLYYRHNRLGHALVRNSDYFGWTHINSAGFRGTKEVSIEKPQGVTRVMVLGSSTTFDSFVEKEQFAWPARLEERLQARLGSPVEVINAGVPGHSVMDNLYRLQTELFAYKPDVLILYAGDNDLLGALRRGAEDGTGGSGRTPGKVDALTPWGEWLEENSLMYAKLAARLGAIQFRSRGRAALERQGGEQDRFATRSLDRGVDKLTRDLGAILAVAQSLGLRVVVPQLLCVSCGVPLAEMDSATRQIWKVTVPFAEPETVLRGYARFDSVTRVLAPRYGATYVPTAQFGIHGLENYAPFDPIHFNGRGSARMAEGLADALVSGALLGPVGTVPGKSAR